MLTSRARLSVGVFSLGVHRLTCTRVRAISQGTVTFNRAVITGRVLYTSLSQPSLPLIERQGEYNSLWLHTRNQMPNWLSRRWSCWSSSLLSNSMLSREWWEADRPIWRRLLSSNSRCSAWISASLSKLCGHGYDESRKTWWQGNKKKVCVCLCTL